ncbi:hypothetical protein [Micropruina sonneratiae]|uniref:hypothetical protein n=1 Tax=Micropruina sonneratiae TaxID=2986940 RepID=UPI0022277634|nr:hypothetical protein [Micropruina sp. KQZ13P-5]MCW3159646.1 hypothetical protein [Micropruina sp. KQZ13P-5]
MTTLSASPVTASQVSLQQITVRIACHEFTADEPPTPAAQGILEALSQQPQ